MSFRGFGYGYHYSAPDNPQSNHYGFGPSNDIPDAPSVANPIQNASRDHQQPAGWQRPDPSSFGDSNTPNGNYWMNNNNHTQRPDQPPYPHHTSSRSMLGSGPNTGQHHVHQSQFEPQPVRANLPNTATYNNGSLSKSGSRSNARTLNSNLNQEDIQYSQAPAASTASRTIDYQSNNTMEPVPRPASGQRERDAAASAMTALSSSLPPRSLAQNQQQQYSISSNSPPAASKTMTRRSPSRDYLAPPNVSTPQAAGQNMNQYTTGSHSLPSRNNVTAYPERSSHSPSIVAAPHRQSPQMQQNLSHDMPPTAPPGYANAAPSQQQQRQYQQQPSSAQSSPRVPSLASILPPTHSSDSHQIPPNHVDAAPNLLNKDNSSGATSQPLNSLPNFVDPSQIYNPYHIEVRAAMERKLQEEASEGRRTQIADAEAEAERRREERERQRQEEQERAEAEVRKHLEAMGQASSARTCLGQSVSHQNQRSDDATRGVEMGATASDRTIATALAEQPEVQQGSHQKPQRKRQPEAQKKAQQTGQQDAKRPSPRKRGPKKKSEPANGGTPGQPTTAGGNPTAGTPGEPEDDMATELKDMIGKMKKWKKQDPMLFAKLLEDLKPVSFAHYSNLAGLSSMCCRLIHCYATEKQLKTTRGC